MTKHKGVYTSMIDNTYIVSESEIAMIYPQYNISWYTDQIEDLKTVLWDLGMDTQNENFTLQDVTQHRNRLNQIVTCSRYAGLERSDSAWINSGYASQAAIDKSRNSRMTDDLYREKGLTVDMQQAMEKKDKYQVVEDEEESW